MRKVNVLLLIVVFFSPAALAAIGGFSLPFEVGDQIDTQKEYSPYTLEPHTVHWQEEGESGDAPYFLIRHDGEIMLDMHVSPGSDETIWQVEEIYVISPKYRDSAGMHIGAKVSDFFARYPQAGAYYAPEYDSIWLESGQGYGLKYGVSMESYRMPIDVDSDRILLKKEGFDDKAIITHIRIYLREYED